MDRLVGAILGDRFQGPLVWRLRRELGVAVWGDACEVALMKALGRESEHAAVCPC